MIPTHNVAAGIAKQPASPPNDQTALWLKHPETERKLQVLRQSRQEILGAAEAAAAQYKTEEAIRLLLQANMLRYIVHQLETTL
jgi:hypothetical protein